MPAWPQHKQHPRDLSPEFLTGIKVAACECWAEREGHEGHRREWVLLQTKKVSKTNPHHPLLFPSSSPKLSPRSSLQPPGRELSALPGISWAKTEILVAHYGSTASLLPSPCPGLWLQSICYQLFESPAKKAGLSLSQCGARALLQHIWLPYRNGSLAVPGAKLWREME